MKCGRMKHFYKLVFEWRIRMLKQILCTHLINRWWLHSSALIVTAKERRQLRMGVCAPLLLELSIEDEPPLWSIKEHCATENEIKQRGGEICVRQWDHKKQKNCYRQSIASKATQTNSCILYGHSDYRDNYFAVNVANWRPMANVRCPRKQTIH